MRCRSVGSVVKEGGARTSMVVCQRRSAVGERGAHRHCLARGLISADVAVDGESAEPLRGQLVALAPHGLQEMGVVPAGAGFELLRGHHDPNVVAHLVGDLEIAHQAGVHGEDVELFLPRARRWPTPPGRTRWCRRPACALVGEDRPLTCDGVRDAAAQRSREQRGVLLCRRTVPSAVGTARTATGVPVSYDHGSQPDP